MASRGLRAGRALFSRGAAAACSGTTFAASAMGTATASAVASSVPSSTQILPSMRATGSLFPASVRGMAGGAHGEAVTHGGLTLHKPVGWQKNVGTFMGAVMWFWVFVRLYHETDVLLFGPEIHLRGDHDDEHH